jgi:hypothetical protein
MPTGARNVGPVHPRGPRPVPLSAPAYQLQAPQPPATAAEGSAEASALQSTHGTAIAAPCLPKCPRPRVACRGAWAALPVAQDSHRSIAGEPQTLTGGTSRRDAHRRDPQAVRCRAAPVGAGGLRGQVRPRPAPATEAAARWQPILGG